MAEIHSSSALTRGRGCELAAEATALPPCVFDRGRLSRTIDRLARDGWVRREDAGVDGRGQCAVLAAEGLNEVRRAARHHVEQVRELVAGDGHGR